MAPELRATRTHAPPPQPHTLLDQVVLVLVIIIGWKLAGEMFHAVVQAMRWVQTWMRHEVEVEVARAEHLVA